MRHFSEMPNVLKSTSLACYTSDSASQLRLHFLRTDNIPVSQHTQEEGLLPDFPNDASTFISVFGQLLLMFNFQQNFQIFSQKSMQVDVIVLFDMINFAEQTTRFLCSGGPVGSTSTYG